MTSTNKSTLAEKDPFSLLKIIFTLLSIIMLRLFLENFVYPNPTGYFFQAERFIHAILYFSSLFLSLSILVYLFAKVSFERILTFMVKIFLFILTVPVIDFIFNTLSPDKASMAYLIISPDKFAATFFNIINFFNGQGITFGQHFASLGILLSLVFFVYKKTQSVAKALLLIISIYATLFFYEMIPSFIVLFGDKEIVTSQNTLSAYYAILNQSWFQYYAENLNFLDKLFLKTETVHELAMAKIFFILLVSQVGTIFVMANQKIWNALKKDLKIERLLYWFIIATIGIVINSHIFGATNLSNPLNLISLVAFFMLMMINGWLAALINDAEDIHIDEISNPNRPLVAKTISPQDWNLMQIILLLLIIIGSATMNKATISLFIFAQISYYLYSVKPIRLKHHFVTSSIMVGLTSVMAAMAGFFLISPDQHVSAFPIEALLIIGFSYALLSNLKDIKDFEGDKHEGIKTIPAVFGLKTSKHIIAILCSIVLIVTPIILKVDAMLFFSIFISIFLYYLFIKKEYQEKYIFLVLFLYIATFFFTTY